MHVKLPSAAVRRQPASADPSAEPRSANADLIAWLDRVREAMTITGWTVDALAAEWDLDRGYVWKLVDGEKSWSVERKLSLPKDIREQLALLDAEHEGLIVIKPVDDATADRYIAIGTLSKMRRSLPWRTAAPVKAKLRTDLAKEISK